MLQQEILDTHSSVSVIMRPMLRTATSPRVIPSLSLNASIRPTTTMHFFLHKRNIHKKEVVVVVLAVYRSITTRLKYEGTSSTDCREGESHAQGLYPTQYTSRMEQQR